MSYSYDMNNLLIAIQILIALAMLDVWLLRYNRPLRARGGDAQTMAEEFKVYGLPDWLLPVVRVLKLSAGALMLVGIGYPIAAPIAGLMLVVLMAGAILMHFKVKAPVLKAVPAIFFFALNCYVVYAYRELLLG